MPRDKIKRKPKHKQTAKERKRTKDIQTARDQVGKRKIQGRKS